MLGDRCGGLLASAMVLLKQGDEQGGKMLLTKALKYAHNQLGNFQFVSQVLSCLMHLKLHSL